MSLAVGWLPCLAEAGQAQTTKPQQPAPSTAGQGASPASAPSGFVIGPDDVLSVVFWREKEMSADVVVRPDGKISLPLLNDLQAAGHTPEQLREQLTKAASKFIEEPNVTVVVKQINSQKVFVTGNVARQGAHALVPNMTVLQLIAVAGGLLEFADADKILVVRTEGGKTQYLKFNYDEVIHQRNIQQNILLKPNDTVVVP
jgi:polysaccharide export outer membrane protein